MFKNYAKHNSKNNSITNDIIKIIYNNDDGNTIKKAIESKHECAQYKDLGLDLKMFGTNKNYEIIQNNKTLKNNKTLNNNKTLKNNGIIYNNKQDSISNSNPHNHNNTKKNITTGDISIKCFTRKKNIKRQPKIIISDTLDNDKYDNDKYDNGKYDNDKYDEDDDEARILTKKL